MMNPTDRRRVEISSLEELGNVDRNKIKSVIHNFSGQSNDRFEEFYGQLPEKFQNYFETLSDTNDSKDELENFFRYFDTQTNFMILNRFVANLKRKLATQTHDETSSETTAGEFSNSVEKSLQPLDSFESLNNEERSNFRTVFQSWIEDKNMTHFSAIPQRVTDYIQANSVQISEMHRQLRVYLKRLGGVINEHHADGLATAIVDWIKQANEQSTPLASVRAATHDITENAASGKAAEAMNDDLFGRLYLVFTKWNDFRKTENHIDQLPVELSDYLQNLPIATFKENLREDVQKITEDDVKTEEFLDALLVCFDVEPMQSLDEITTIQHPQLENAFQCWKSYSGPEYEKIFRISSVLERLPISLKTYFLSLSIDDATSELSVYCEMYIGSIGEHAFDFSESIAKWVHQEAKNNAAKENYESELGPAQAFLASARAHAQHRETIPNEPLERLSDMTGAEHDETKAAYRYWREHHTTETAESVMQDVSKLLPTRLNQYISLLSHPENSIDLDQYLDQAIPNCHPFFHINVLDQINKEAAELQKMGEALDDVSSINPILDVSENPVLAPEDVPQEQLQSLTLLTPAEKDRFRVAINLLMDKDIECADTQFAENCPERVISFIENRLKYPRLGYPLETNVSELIRGFKNSQQDANHMAQILVHHAQLNINTSMSEEEILGLDTFVTPPQVTEKPAFLVNEQEELSARAEAHTDFKALCEKHGVYDHVLLTESKFKKDTWFDRITTYSKKRFRIVGIDYAGRNIQIAEVVRGKFNDKAPGVPFEKVVTEYLKK